MPYEGEEHTVTHCLRTANLELAPWPYLNLDTGHVVSTVFYSEKRDFAVIITLHNEPGTHYTISFLFSISH